MASEAPSTVSAFSGHRLVTSGPLPDVAVALAAASATGASEPVLVVRHADGEQIDLDLRGSEQAIRARYGPRSEQVPPATPRGRGRPRLGVVAREVTLLPEHWDWLASQPGGTSVALRKLVQEARRAGTGRDRLRRAQERSYKVMVALAGNLPQFEEAARALFAHDIGTLRARIDAWPQDVRDLVLQLADPETAADVP